MIPYIYLDEILLGPITIHWWGLMVALGFGIGLYVNYRLAKRQLDQSDVVFDLGFWVIVASIIGARFGHVVFYELDYYLQYPLDILKVWHGGFSSVGGMFGALIMALWYFKRHKLKFWDWVDYFVFGFPLGMGIGRIGCSFIHDHPGVLTDFPLGVQYPNGARHDLGLYLMLFNFFIFALFLVIKARFDKRNKKLNQGVLFITYLLVYGFGRFWLDFLRVSGEVGADARYLNLTPAQWTSLLFIITAFYFIFQKKQNK